MIRKSLKLLIVCIISIIIGKMSYGIYKEMKLADAPKEEVENNEIIEKVTNSQKKQMEKITNNYKGYSVSAKLEIPRIDLETYVFKDYDEEAMWICPTKYFGPEPNEVGNYCIAAHNYDKENMFNHIINLKLGDNIYLSDNKYGIVEYEVYDVYKVKPTDNTPLEQNTQGRVEITLITCSDYSSKRIIVKARKT